VTEAVLEQDVAYTVEQQSGATVDGVQCGGGLDAKVGDSVRCTVTGGGDQIDLNVSVSSLDKGLISYDLQLA
jgi:Domain of unknown function (DUF4333)